ncbi:MAG: hypothetical protein K9H64_22225 [Bacteroidales bacterium]|nr:hypothetical protein [Bacteroidales bacterium]MCF8458767.1 hypothetical protein [Bacteroidales bacterium]
MASKKSKRQQSPAYTREQGRRNAIGNKQRKITFSFSKHIKDDKGIGQSIEEWERLGLLKPLILRMKNLGQHTTLAVRQYNWIKEYHKVDFPPHSEFAEPKHVTGVTWAVMHITDNSKEVVVGYIEEDVFYIIFLDKDHKFWPSELKNT